MCHLILDIHKIENTQLLNDKRGLELLAIHLCDRLHFHILHQFTYEFQPQGITIVFALRESHLTFHTYPEEQRIAVDIYTCKDQQQQLEYISQMLVKIFKGDRLRDLLLSRL